MTKSEYDKFYQSIKAEMVNVSIPLEQLQEAQYNYFITVKYILDLANPAYNLFLSSKVEEIRQLIKLVPPNLRIEGEKLLYKP